MTVIGSLRTIIQHAQLEIAVLVEALNAERLAYDPLKYLRCPYACSVVQPWRDFHRSDHVTDFECVWLHDLTRPR